MFYLGVADGTRTREGIRCRIARFKSNADSGCYCGEKPNTPPVSYRPLVPLVPLVPSGVPPVPRDLIKSELSTYVVRTETKIDACTSLLWYPLAAVEVAEGPGGLGRVGGPACRTGRQSGRYRTQEGIALDSGYPAQPVPVMF